MERQALLFNSHRRNSFTLAESNFNPTEEEIAEITELRARERTFEGSYIRTALANLGYSALILKVFSSEFAKIGLLYTILSILLLLIGMSRSHRAQEDFADIYRTIASQLPGTFTVVVPSTSKRWGRPFRTSGSSVVLIGGTVAAIEFILLVFVLQLA